MGELGYFFLAEDGLKNVAYSVIEVEGLSRRGSITSLLESSFALSFPFASPNMPSWISSLLFPSFVVLESTNIRYNLMFLYYCIIIINDDDMITMCVALATVRVEEQPFPFRYHSSSHLGSFCSSRNYSMTSLNQLVGAPYLDATECIKYLKKKQVDNKNNAHNSLNGITFTEHHFRPTFNKHMGAVCKGIRMGTTFHLREQSTKHKEEEEEEEEEEVDAFAVGLYFLFFVISTRAKDFKWRAPQEGYEYNFTDPPLLLILGDDRWWECLEGLRLQLISLDSEGGSEAATRLCSEAEAHLEQHLQWAHEDAQNFAERSSFVHIYR